MRPPTAPSPAPHTTTRSTAQPSASPYPRSSIARRTPLGADATKMISQRRRPSGGRRVQRASVLESRRPLQVVLQHVQKHAAHVARRVHVPVPPPRRSSGESRHHRTPWMSPVLFPFSLMPTGCGKKLGDWLSPGHALARVTPSRVYPANPIVAMASDTANWDAGSARPASTRGAPEKPMAPRARPAALSADAE